MTENPNLPYVLGPDEKAASVMVYTHNALAWGEVVVRQIVRVSTWLRTNSAPDDICLYNARLLLTASNSIKPIFMRELHVSTPAVLAFHLVPPAKDPVDYDESEPNRKMEPVTAVVSNFRIDGYVRMSTQATLSKFLEISKETYTSIYDAEISSPILQALGVMKVPYLIVRQVDSFIALR